MYVAGDIVTEPPPLEELRACHSHSGLPMEVEFEVE